MFNITWILSPFGHKGSPVCAPLVHAHRIRSSDRPNLHQVLPRLPPDGPSAHGIESLDERVQDALRM